MPPVSEAPRRVLAVLDWALAIAGSFAIVSVLVEPPLGGWVASVTFIAILIATTSVAVAGLFGRAPWRAHAYPLIAFVSAAIALWTNGPLAGVGAVLTLAALLAAALGDRRMVILVCGAGVGVLSIRSLMAVGAWGSPDPGVLVLDDYRLWFRVAFTTAIMMWIATRVLEEVRASLEGALELTADAYRAEVAMRAELDVKRRELDDLEQAEMIGRLAGGVAHDVNNALTGILAVSEILVDDVQTDGQRRALANLEAASHHAAELVRDLLWIGRKFPPTTQVAALTPTVDLCVARLARMSRKIALTCEPCGTLQLALAPERLEQMLFWLVIEAERTGITAMSLAARREGSEVVIELAARTAASAERTSGRLVHADLSASATRDVIEQVGGRVTIAGAGLDTRIELRLPAAAALQAPDRTGASGTSALVVDDEALVLERLARLVAARGYTVVTAASLEEAWPKLEAGCDLLVTDLQLGDGRGEDLALASFAQAPGRPIVICSGFGADDALRDRLRGARLVFLTKPFTRAELEAAIPCPSSAEAAT